MSAPASDAISGRTATVVGSSPVAPLAADLRVGTEIAGYRVCELIGRGGMGVVYLAEHRHLQRRVALKVLVPELAGGPGFRERFIRESRLAAAIDHPNIVTVYDAGEAGDLLYIAMRYVEGTDLAALLRRDGALEPVRDLPEHRERAGSSTGT
jgi:serine/threonine protein kinase